MNLLKKYTIPHKGLSAGKHRYEFEVDDRFFAAFEGSEIRQGSARIGVELEKGGSMLQLQVAICGEVIIACDRCLEPCPIPVAFDGLLVVRFSEESREYDGEVMWLHPGETELNLAQYVYESILLNLPYRRIHADGPDGKPGCDPEMLFRFSIVTPEEFERMAAETEKNRTEDNPGFEKLKELKAGME